MPVPAYLLDMMQDRPGRQTGASRLACFHFLAKVKGGSKF